MTTVQRTYDLASRALRHAWRLVILVLGLSVVAFGLALVVLPGPAFVVIPVGLAILATEFVWARRLLHNLKERGRDLINWQRRDGSSGPEPGRPSGPLP